MTLSSIGDGLIATDDQGRVLFMNTVAENLTGWSIDEAKYTAAETVFQLLDETSGHPVANPIDRALKSGMILQLDNDMLLRQKNQKTIPIADSAAPIQKDDGEIIGGVLVFRDISEKKRRDEALAQALQNWDAMFRSIGQITLIIDPNHGIMDANDMALKATGLSKEDLVGRKCFEVFHGTTKPPDTCHPGTRNHRTW